MNRRHFIKTLLTSSAGAMTLGCSRSHSTRNKVLAHNQTSVMGLALPAYDVVRIAFIGVGARGSGLVKHCCHIEGVEIKAICDTNPVSLQKSCDYVQSFGRLAPQGYTGNDDVYKDMLNRDDIDIVIIATPWAWHTPMAVDTMLSGKHAFIEVPAATSIEDCWRLVDTAEQTQKHCMMLENVCYGRDELMVLNMVRQGVFGELLHGEAAYIHELREQMKDMDYGTGSWRTRWHTHTNGNLYPTHGLGPIAQYMNINRGDRFDFITSVSSPALGREAYAQREFADEHHRNRVNYIAGDMNTSIIKTKLGRSIVVQHDTTTPRPYSRHNLIQGTNGVFAGFPNRIALEVIPSLITSSSQRSKETHFNASLPNSNDNRYHQWDYDMDKWRQAYEHPLWTKMGEQATRNGGHGGMDFLMLWRLIYCLRNGMPLDQTVYDAAAWSSIFPLSVRSVNERSNSQCIPDFTRGAWETASPLSIDS